MALKKLNTNVIDFNLVEENVSEPTITSTDFATCVKCRHQFTESEWDTIEKNIGWEVLPNKPKFESFKIRCSDCNQLNIWTRRER